MREMRMDRVVKQEDNYIVNKPEVKNEGHDEYKLDNTLQQEDMVNQRNSCRKKIVCK